MMAPAGRGRFTTVKPTEHAQTAAGVIERFTGRYCSFARMVDGIHEVTVL